MPFVGRRADHSIYGLWTVRQVENQEFLPNDNVEIVAFRTLPAPVDLSDIDNAQDKALKALALCVAQIGGLTVPQMKALFRQKWDLLP